MSLGVISQSKIVQSPTRMTSSWSLHTIIVPKTHKNHHETKSINGKQLHAGTFATKANRKRPNENKSVNIARQKIWAKNEMRLHPLP